MRKTGLLFAALTFHCLMASVRADEKVMSKPVEKDGIAASISVGKQQIDADGQPILKIRFENKSRDYINLYDVEAGWRWRVVFTKLDAAGDAGKNWRLQFDVVHEGRAIAFKQVKAGEALEVTIDLANDPPFTFTYVADGARGEKPSSVRRLKPGKYEVRATISLKNPFGQDRHMWTGPVTTESAPFTVLDRHRERPSVKELAAYDKALQPVIELSGEKHGLWLNGGFPIIKLAKDTDAEDVIAAVVNCNRSNLDSKAYRVLRIKRLDDDEGKRFVALISAGKSTKAMLCFPTSDGLWWSRLYDATIEKADPTKAAESPGK